MADAFSTRAEQAEEAGPDVRHEPVPPLLPLGPPRPIEDDDPWHPNNRPGATRADAYILVMPDGTDDGFLWAGTARRTLDDARRLFARPRQWPTLAREGYRVDAVTADQFRTRSTAAIAAHTPGGTR